MNREYPNVQFEIEQVLEVKSRNQVYVLARQLAPDDWNLSSSSMLGGARIENWMEIPRALDSAGKQRLDYFAFCLCDPSDRIRFSVGQLVKLAP